MMVCSAKMLDVNNDVETYAKLYGNDSRYVHTQQSPITELIPCIHPLQSRSIASHRFAWH